MIGYNTSAMNGACVEIRTGLWLEDVDRLSIDELIMFFPILQV
jgi:hypothetical protein